MKIIIIINNLFLFTILNAAAQNDYTLNMAPKHKIWVSTTGGNVIKGALVSSTDSSVNIFPGKFSEWHS